MESTVLNIDWSKLPDPTTVSTKTFMCLLEVYIDDFVALLIQSTNIDDITHLTRCLLHAITDMFPLQKSLAAKWARLFLNGSSSLKAPGSHARKSWIGY